MSNRFEIPNRIQDAVNDDDVEAVKRLLQAHPEHWGHMTVFGSWLHVAAGEGRLEVVQLLIELGADVEVRGGIGGGTPLNFAAAEGRLEVVRCLLAHGATMDLREPIWNPLFSAIRGGHTHVAKLLIESGVDTEIKYSGENMRDMDALSFARHWGRTDIAALLPHGEGRGTGGYR